MDCTHDDLERSWKINVLTMFDTVQAVLPGMLERDHGSIINIASVVSSVTSAPGRFAYGTTKAAVIGLTKSIAIEYVTKGVRCNAICPGTVDSPSLRQRLEATGDYSKARAEFEARQPMKRLGKAEEVGALAAYLASDRAGFTTGTTQMIDGGWTI
jgi:2-keto-3-deoxy-L-fuconate dehydrogenase